MVDSLVKKMRIFYFWLESFNNRQTVLSLWFVISFSGEQCLVTHVSLIFNLSCHNDNKSFSNELQFCSQEV